MQSYQQGRYMAYMGPLDWCWCALSWSGLVLDLPLTLRITIGYPALLRVTLFPHLTQASNGGYQIFRRYGTGKPILEISLQLCMYVTKY